MDLWRECEIGKDPSGGLRFELCVYLGNFSSRGSPEARTFRYLRCETLEDAIAKAVEIRMIGSGAPAVILDMLDSGKIVYRFGEWKEKDK